MASLRSPTTHHPRRRGVLAGGGFIDPGKAVRALVCLEQNAGVQQFAGTTTSPR